MNEIDRWMEFMKTGRVTDYLRYMACAKEEDPEEQEYMDREKDYGRSYNSNGNCTCISTNRGL